MNNINILGVNNSYLPLSNAFSIDIINKKFTFNKNILSITNINISISSDCIDTFSVLDNRYATVALDIHIRFDYICSENSINYEIVTINKLINICIGNHKFNKKITTHANMLDAGIVDIDGCVVQFYIIPICSLGI